jgi:hypothetical protein
MAKIPVKMLSHMAGTGRDEGLEVGKTYDVEKKFGERLIERELAEPVEKTSKRETATRETRETAVVPSTENR